MADDTLTFDKITALMAKFPAPLEIFCHPLDVIPFEQTMKHYTGIAVSMAGVPEGLLGIPVIEKPYIARGKVVVMPKWGTEGFAIFDLSELSKKEKQADGSN